MTTVARLIVCEDILSIMATSNNTSSPGQASSGRALVVYSPGFSGAAKNAAAMITGDLQSKGYTVKLTGIKDAADISGYDVIVAGGPMYFGKVGGAVEAYLKGLRPQKNVRLGVFATTGSAQFNDGDIAMFGKQVAALPVSSALSKPVVTKTIRSGDAARADCSAFVSAVLQ